MINIQGEAHRQRKRGYWQFFADEKTTPEGGAVVCATFANSPNQPEAFRTKGTANSKTGGGEKGEMGSGNRGYILDWGGGGTTNALRARTEGVVLNAKQFRNRPGVRQESTTADGMK